jgi:glycosyltransferase involved in cell wall biosynthesis
MGSPIEVLGGGAEPGLAVPAAPQVEIVVPVRNEERHLAPSIQRLYACLRDRFPFTARITIADNGSTDGTWAQALALAGQLDLVRAVRLYQPGRGRALRSVWSASDCEVLAYMDADLSTDLNALLPLVAPLLSGHSDVAIGTRLAQGARLIRGPRREVISRCYNLVATGLRYALYRSWVFRGRSAPPPIASRPPDRAVPQPGLTTLAQPDGGIR